MPKKEQGTTIEMATEECRKCRGTGTSQCTSCGGHTKMCRVCLGAGNLITREALREARLAAGIHPLDIAMKMGMTRAYVYGVENGNTPMSAKIGAAIMEAINEIVHERTMAVAS